MSKKIQPLEEPMSEPEREAVTFRMMPGGGHPEKKMNLRLWLRGEVLFRWVPEFGLYVNRGQRSKAQKAMLQRGVAHHNSL